jgi:hypothetical protein
MGGCDGTTVFCQVTGKTPLACSSKYANKLLGPTSGRQFLDQLKDCSMWLVERTALFTEMVKQITKQITNNKKTNNEIHMHYRNFIFWFCIPLRVI